jgi:hypothetical protein
MCADPACPSTAKPPPGESWCPARLRIELMRWVSCHPGMKCGRPVMVAEMLAR